MQRKTAAIAAGLLIFIIALSVAGYLGYKYYSSQTGGEMNDSFKKTEKDAEGFVDCGKSTTPLEDFDEPFFETDFEQDEAFVCMGENINDNCSKAKSIIDVDGADLIFKMEEGCKARLEAEDSGQKLIWAECPISALMSFAQEEAVSVEEFGQILDKMEQGNGNRAAAVFALMAMTLNFNLADFEELGCSRSEN